MYSNKILNFQESTTILNAHTKKNLETYRMHLVYNSYQKPILYLYLPLNSKDIISDPVRGILKLRGYNTHTC